jgi:drug/metabolite transporter (DMT)-like permease
MNFLWVVFTLCGAVGQVARNAMQRGLTPQLGPLGATLVRFLFGFPFALLFLAVVLTVTQAPLPAFGRDFALWLLAGALTQIGGTALMLAAMEQRSFVVVTAYLKTEPVLVALMGLTFLHDPLTPLMALAITLAMVGVLTVSVKADTLRGGAKPAFQGIASAALFGASAVGYRGAILSLHSGFVVASTVSLAAGLTLQTVLLMAWLLLFDRGTLKALARLWRPSLMAGFTGAAASQFWFLAFALATAASVRTLALVEVLFALALTRFAFKQKTTMREAVGILLLLAGAVLIVWAHPS